MTKCTEITIQTVNVAIHGRFLEAAQTFNLHVSTKLFCNLAHESAVSANKRKSFAFCYESKVK